MVVLSSFLTPTEGIRHEQPNTVSYLNTRQLGKGTLYITESRVSWRDSTSGEGFSLEYPHITLHAVSRDLTSFPQECLYLMLDADVEKTGGDSGSEEDEDDDAGMTEIRFIPDDKGVLNLLFDVVKDCQTLHPDPEDSFSDAEDEIYADAEEGDEDQEVSSGAEGPIIQLRPSNNDVFDTRNGNQEEEMDLDPGQFEDADDFESNQ
ncbi:hypothetical protein B566_EDAN004410 [Ephemera danica]|nr:hypothetical protein B566_EDAN004410 [Ephemera danica]